MQDNPENNMSNDVWPTVTQLAQVSFAAAGFPPRSGREPRAQVKGLCDILAPKPQTVDKYFFGLFFVVLVVVVVEVNNSHCRAKF